MIESKEDNKMERYSKEELTKRLLKEMDEIKQEHNFNLDITEEDIARRIQQLTNEENLEVLQKFLILLDNGNRDALKLVTDLINQKSSK